MPMTTLEQGVATLTRKHYNDLIEVGKEYNYKKVRNGTNTYYIVYFNDEWGRPDKRNYMIQNFEQFFTIKE